MILGHKIMNHLGEGRMGMDPKGTVGLLQDYYIIPWKKAS